MNAHRFQGWAFIISAVFSLIGLVFYTLIREPDSSFLTVILLLSSILFLVGLPAIQAKQPQTGMAGQIGLVLMGIGALLALILTFTFRVTGANIGETLPSISALAALVGAILVGWLTIRASAFPAWVGWLLIIGSVCNALSGEIPSGSMILAVIGTLASAAALIGYGLGIIQQSAPRLQGV